MRGLPWMVFGAVGVIAACGYPPLGPPGDDAGGENGPGPMVTCVTPSSWNFPKSYVKFSTNPPGRAGTDNTCPQIGSIMTADVAQYMWCQSSGGEVVGSNGIANHWWLWTDLDDPGGSRGWISASYISGQGSGPAIDMTTMQPIPTCP